eukprot:Gregarina_sp_Poly_1__5215@NODE_2765_length_1747_cov_76_045833_g1744_i0_p1_GENE_NODE_2765_length_1747_cov_76_045833_g1744_i0NODE_2765_length_1747_cov_76_045833_g1744_i0_p1_ORF_typecomplete_len278_score41_03CHB_HEX_C_1/PF13290_6/1e04CHB_HEX_C_1/PF13290_6/0_25_NODE_2765_length_1747_cov_76_045833_g1744_i072905
MEDAIAVLKGCWDEQRASLLKAYPGTGAITRDHTINAPLRELLSFEPQLSTKHDLLSILLDLRDLLEPLDHLAVEKSKTISHLTSQYRVGTLLGLSRRLGPHVRPPPEYNDSSGADAFCVPGYVFPCPDTAMMLRSTLFLGGAPEAVMRCLPPEISAVLQTGFTSAYKLHLTSSTDSANFFYSVNLDSLRPFNAAQPPTLSAPGEYTIQAYCVAPNYLPSEMSIKNLNLVVQESKIESKSSSVVSQKSSVLSAKERNPQDSVFGDFFLGDDDDSDED